MKSVDLKIGIGKKYVARDKTVFLITKELPSSNPGYDKGYRFIGETDYQGGDVAFQIKYSAMFKPNGQHIIDGVSSPSDLIHLYIPKIPCESILEGMDIGEMIDSEITSGLLDGWVVSDIFPISENMYHRISDRTDVKITHRCNRMLAISSVESCEGYALKVLVGVWRCGNASREDTYFCATVSRPD